MIYTSYFANLKNIPSDVCAISIARYSPIDIPYCSLLFSSKELLFNYKNNLLNEKQYEEQYLDQLRKIDAK